MRAFGMIVAAILVFNGTSAIAQTPLSTQPVDNVDPCAPDDGMCWASHDDSRNYVKARKAFEHLAEHGDAIAALWLGESYDEPAWVRVPIDHVQAYKWYDIAAALKAREIAKDGPAPNGSLTPPDDNKTEINYRDECIQYLNNVQLMLARHWSHEWQSEHPEAMK